jgi:hypothetical protein
MIIHDDIYEWEGFGRQLRLGHGRCRLQLIDLSRDDTRTTFLKPMIAVLSDVADSPMSARSSIGHIATCIARDFSIPPSRMVVVEYSPARCYGTEKQHEIASRCEMVEFTWHDGKAIQPQWRPLPPNLEEQITQQLNQHKEPEPINE